MYEGGSVQVVWEVAISSGFLVGATPQHPLGEEPMRRAAHRERGANGEENSGWLGPVYLGRNDQYAPPMPTRPWGFLLSFPVSLKAFSNFRFCYLHAQTLFKVMTDAHVALSCARHHATPAVPGRKRVIREKAPMGEKGTGQWGNAPVKK